MEGNNFDEEFVPEEDAENPAGAIKKLREKLRASETERQEYLDGWQRARADLANFKRDEEDRRQMTAERIKASVAEDVIRVLDGFEMGFKSATFDKADPEWQKGIKGLYSQLLQVLKNMGVEQIGKVGEKFNPRLHEAFKEVPVDSEEKDHTIVDIFASGYTLGEHTVRPAQVSVGVFQK
jgi:molecular chaperone GrpE